MSAQASPTRADAILSGSETTHYCCCEHPDTALCGVDVRDADEDDVEVSCIVCADLFDNSPEFCPRRAFCPQFVVPA